jgi:hypothetical protein
LLLADFGGPVAAPWSAPCEEIARRHGVVRLRPGTSSAEDVADYLGTRAVVRPLEPVPMDVRRSLGRDIDDWERQIHAWTWPYPQATIGRVCEAIRQWAVAERVELDDEITVTRTIRWWAFDVTG